MSSEKGIEKSGYLEVKQPSTTKGRKLKTWKKRWVVVHQMSDLASRTFNAKIDIYPDEATVIKTPSDKMTFVLENITAVRLSKSKTHPHAFEVVESEPVLVFCATTEQETATWMSIYDRICQHDSLAEYDMFGVHIIQNPHSKRLNLEEKILLSINTSVIRLLSYDYKTLVEWRLSGVKRFYTIENMKDTTKRVLVLECGPNAETGEGMFCFATPEWELILQTIRKNISMAIADRQRLKASQGSRDRAGSATNSVYQFSNLLENSDNPMSMSMRTVRSCSEMSVVSSASERSSTSTPPMSPVLYTEGNFNIPPITSTPDPHRNIRAGSVFHIDDGYLEIKGTGDSNQLNTKPRSGSISSNTSSVSHRSRVSTSQESGILDAKPELPGRKSSEASQRAVSNSFDSGFSNGSYEDTKRKGSDVDTAIKEETSEKCEQNNIYQELDYAKVLLHRLSENLDEKRERRHSTGDVGKEPDYEELKSRKNEQGIFSDAMPKVHLIPETPPALPDRPASFRVSSSHKVKSNWKKRLSGLSFLGSKTGQSPGNSPGNSPERCESPLHHQKSQIVSSDIVLDNVNATLAKVCQLGSEEIDSLSPTVNETEHFYQSIPDVLQQIRKQPFNQPSNQPSTGAINSNDSSISVAGKYVSPEDVKQTDPIVVDVDNDINNSPIAVTGTGNEPNIDNGDVMNKSSPLIDFFFKDDGFERLRAQSNASQHNPEPPSLPGTQLLQVPILSEAPLIDFSSSESLVTTSASQEREGHYMDMTKHQAAERSESVEYVPPSEMRDAISNGNLIDIT